MEIRGIDLRDFSSLLDLVVEVYRDSPSAMWFEKEPDKEIFSLVFGNKLVAITEKNAIDMVAVEGGQIIGNCEIVRKSGETGVLGIIVAKDWRRKGVGSSLLDEAIRLAAGIGIYRLRAEFLEENGGAALFLAKKGFSPNGSARRETRTGIRNVMLMTKDI